MSWFSEKTPDAARTFSELRNSVYKEGALDQRTEELISVAASTLMRCERCTQLHIERAKKQGATDEMIAEAVVCAMAAQNMMLAAHSRGIGSCWTGLVMPALMDEQILKELGAPAGYKAVAPPHIRIPTGQNRSSDPGTKRA